jgi:non-ribosomal peptide synthetase component F
MTLLAAFQVLLSCYTQQEDLVVGSVIAGRGRAEIEGLIGFFVNTLALRSDLSGDPTFRELLSRVKSVTLGAYEHQDLPFEKLVEALRPVRCFSYSPLIQVMFVLQNTPAQIETREFGSRESPTLSLEIKTGAKNDLTLLMTETEQGLIGELEYSTDIFFSETIARMAGHFRTLLERIVDDAEQRISLLRMAIEAESLQPLVQ